MHHVLPVGAVPGIPSRPAHPGETIVTYGIGFGSVTPDAPAGQIVTGNNQLSTPLQVQIGQIPAQVTYQGLAPGFIGLYRFDIVVPPMPDNTLASFTFTLGGRSGSQPLYTAVNQ